MKVGPLYELNAVDPSLDPSLERARFQTLTLTWLQSLLFKWFQLVPLRRGGGGERRRAGTSIHALFKP
jgi:hypothetical protein